MLKAIQWLGIVFSSLRFSLESLFVVKNSEPIPHLANTTATAIVAAAIVIAIATITIVGLNTRGRCALLWPSANYALGPTYMQKQWHCQLQSQRFPSVCSSDSAAAAIAAAATAGILRALRFKLAWDLGRAKDWI